jgi:hypothetical protein
MSLILSACLLIIPPAPVSASDPSPESLAGPAPHGGLLELEPGTSEEAICRAFGRPSCWGRLKQNSFGKYLSVEWMLNGHRGPTGIPGDLTWFYPLTGQGWSGPGYFVVLRDGKLVRVFRGSLLGVECD